VVAFHFPQLGSGGLDQHGLLVDSVLQVVDDLSNLLVVTRPLLGPWFSGSARDEFARILSFYKRVCLLVRGAILRSRFSSPSIAADCRVFLVGTGSGMAPP
jgi:hypothetical protein